jgi:hypothetical protein
MKTYLADLEQFADLPPPKFKDVCIETVVENTIIERVENKGQCDFDPEADAAKVPVTHVRYKDQKDAFDNRTYKADNKDWPPLANTYLDEPKTF